MTSNFAFKVSDAPVKARSVQGESTTAAAGSGRPLSRNFSNRARASPPPAESPMTAIWRGAVVDHQDPRLCRRSDAPREMPIGRWGTQPVGASMKIEDVAVWTRRRRDDAIGADTTGIDGDGLDAPRRMRNQGFHGEKPPSRLFQRFVTGAALDEPGQAETHRLGPQTDAAVALHARHPARVVVCIVASSALPLSSRTRRPSSMCMTRSANDVMRESCVTTRTPCAGSLAISARMLMMA